MVVKIARATRRSVEPRAALFATAHVLSAILVLTVVIASIFVLMSPIDYAAVEPERMSGKVFIWQWVRSCHSDNLGALEEPLLKVEPGGSRAFTAR